jgi:HTH-type transcriptional regulator/antitoxin HipB
MERIAHNPRQLAQILRGERKSQSLNQEAVGARVKLLTKTVSKLENQPEKSTVESLFKLLSALDLELVVRSKRDSAEHVPELEW